MKFKKGDKVILQLSSGAEKRRAIVVSALRSTTELEVFYINQGKEVSMIGWFKNKWIKINKHDGNKKN